MISDPWLLAAQRLDAWRVIPRLILVFYCAFFAKAWYFIVDWFIAYDWDALPKDQVVGAVAVAAIAGFPAIILGILTKVLRELIQTYLQRPAYLQQRPQSYAATPKPYATRTQGDEI